MNSRAIAQLPSDKNTAKVDEPKELLRANARVDLCLRPDCNSINDTCAWTTNVHMSYYACMSSYADYIHTKTQLSTGASRKAPVDNTF